MAYLRNMLSNTTQFAAANPNDSDDHPGDDWQPFAANDAKGAASSKSAAAAPVATPKVQLVNATEKVDAPSAATRVKSAQAASPQAPTKPSKVAGTPTLIRPIMATPAQIQAAGPAGLLRTDTD